MSVELGPLGRRSILNELRAKLEPLGCTGLEAEFDGSGDSGQCYPVQPAFDGDVAQENYSGAQEILHSNVVGTGGGTYDAIIDDWAVTLVNDDIIPDWVNNEGGSGTVRINWDGSIKIEARVRVVSYDDHLFSSSVDHLKLREGDEDEDGDEGEGGII